MTRLGHAMLDLQAEQIRMEAKVDEGSPAWEVLSLQKATLEGFKHAMRIVEKWKEPDAPPRD